MIATSARLSKVEELRLTYTYLGQLYAASAHHALALID